MTVVLRTMVRGIGVTRPSPPVNPKRILVARIVLGLMIAKSLPGLNGTPDTLDALLDDEGRR